MRASNAAPKTSVPWAMRSLLAAAVLCVSVSACTGDGGGGGSGGGPAANPGSGSGTLRVLATITCATLTEGSAGLATCASYAYVSVEDEPDENDVDDAIVEFGPVGAPVTLASGGNGSYSGSLTGFAEAYQLDVTRGSDFLTGVVLRSPRDFTITLDPDAPAQNEPATVHWSPTESAVSSLVYVYQGFVAQTYTGPAESDDGSESLPGSTFPAAAEYRIEVARGRLMTLDGPFSQGIVILGRFETVTVP